MLGFVMENRVYVNPEEIDTYIAEYKLKSLGASIDKLSEEQFKYLNSWDEV
jgi:adenosylhomocysteinase